MKRHLWPVVCCGLSAMSPLMAQEPYYQPYGYPPGYTAEPNYDTDRTTREFHLNPNNMMNRMANPMSSMFGSSSKRYDAYPPDRYMPPAYGYPANPGYQSPPAYGYDVPAPAYGTYATPYAYPQDELAQPRAARSPTPGNPSVYGGAGAKSPAYPTPAAPSTAYGERYNFRPLENPTSGGASAPAAVIPRQAPAEPPNYGAGYTTPQAAPAEPAPASLMEMQNTLIQQSRGMKFRPLDQPGYTPDLDH